MKCDTQLPSLKGRISMKQSNTDTYKCIHTYTYTYEHSILSHILFKFVFIHTHTCRYMQIYPKYIYKDLRFHPYSTIHAIACPTETVGLQGSNPQPAAARPDSERHCRGSLTSSWPGGRGLCKPVTVTVEWLYPQ